MCDDGTEIVCKKPKLDDEAVAKQPAHCKFFVKRKKRFCKMTVEKGKIFCREHSVSVTESNDDDSRVPCPLDPKHSVDKWRLQKHLKVCNSRKPLEYPNYIKPGINVDSTINSDEDPDFRLTDVDQSEINAIVKTVNELFEENVAGKIEKNIREHKILAEELANETYGSEKRRHIVQTSSILGIMEHEGFLKPKTCFIEYGAGRATLTFWLSSAVQHLDNTKVLVIDRASHRHKRDNLINDREKVERIRADIGDLDLQGLEMLKKFDSLTGVSKHLCGGATDLTLRCLIQGNRHGLRTTGLIICVCCHHQCSWNTFVGKEWFIANGIDRKTFNILIKMVSWCTCGDGLSRDKQKTPEKEAERKEKEEIGWKCKRLIDYARVKYLTDNGYEAKLSFYAEKSDTLENVCITGKLVN